MSRYVGIDPYRISASSGVAVQTTAEEADNWTEV